MPDKYSLAKCEQYGRRLAARLCQQHFGPQPDATLDGPALLQLTPLRQVNLLVLHQLLDRWQHEASQLRSPYFDFEAEPVQAALTQFMNVLSRHIRLNRAALEALLPQAITGTLLLATDPALAFERLLLPPAPLDPAATVPLPYLRERLRYLHQSKALFEGFLHSLPTGNSPLSREFLTQRFELYRASHYKEVPALAPLVAELSALLPLTEADLWDDGPSKPLASRPPAASPLPAEVASPSAAPPAPLPPTPLTAAPATAPTPLAEPTDAPAADAPELEAAAAAPVAPVASAAPPRPVVPSFAAPVAEVPSGVPLYEKLKATQPTGAHLAETLRGTAPEASPRLVERGAPRVGSLREGVSINQRYSFINELFNGETDDYNAAIAQLDQLPTAAAAQEYMQKLATRYDWGGGRKEEHVGRLLKLLERKFADA